MSVQVPYPSCARDHGADKTYSTDPRGTRNSSTFRAPAPSRYAPHILHLIPRKAPIQFLHADTLISDPEAQEFSPSQPEPQRHHRSAAQRHPRSRRPTAQARHPHPTTLACRTSWASTSPPSPDHSSSPAATPVSYPARWILRAR